MESQFRIPPPPRYPQVAPLRETASGTCLQLSPDISAVDGSLMFSILKLPHQKKISLGEILLDSVTSLSPLTAEFVRRLLLQWIGFLSFSSAIK